METELRSFTMPGEYRAAEEDGKKIIEGYYIVFGDIYDMGSGITESIGRHAVDDYDTRDVRVLINHDTKLVLGRSAAGTAVLRVDDHGVFCRTEINERDTDAVNCWARVQRGDVSQASCGFNIIRETMEDRGGGRYHFTIEQMELHELSVCTFPAYRGTSLTARSGDDAHAQVRRYQIWKKEMEERIKKWH